MQALIEFADGGRAVFAPNGTPRDRLEFSPGSEQASGHQDALSVSIDDPRAERIRRIALPNTELQEISERNFPDFILRRGNTSILIETKIIDQVHDRRLAVISRQFDQAFRRYQGGDAGKFEKQLWILSPKIWQLQILSFGDGSDISRIDRLYARLVWSYRAEGEGGREGAEILSTTDIELRVQNWANRIDTLYSSIEKWLSRSEYVTERRNDVVMNEELMRLYAVPPRQLPVLDVKKPKGRETLLSLVPYGLWVIGASGRLDVFTPSERLSLVDIATPGSEPNWMLIRRTRSTLERKAFDAASVRDLLRK